MSLEHTIETEVLVFGGGMAGCFAAIKAREQGVSVILVDKGYVGKSGSTHFAEGDFTSFDPSRGHNKEEWMKRKEKRLSNMPMTACYASSVNLIALKAQYTYHRKKPCL